MDTIELHGAFSWDCDNCGRENFVRAIGGNLDEAAMKEMLGEPVQNLIAEEKNIDLISDDDSSRCESRYLITQLLVSPKTVTCWHCGTEFETEIYCEEE